MQIRQLTEADRREVWITDSGASEHITSRRDWFENLQPVTGETVLLGDDGECEVAVGVCTKKGFRVSFENGVVEADSGVSRGGVVEATGAKQENGLYRMFFRRPKLKREVNVSSLDLKIWHERLGHIHKRALTELVTRELADGINMKNSAEFFCEACQFGKLHKLPFKGNSSRASTVPGEYIHSDVCGPVPTQSIGGARFYVLFKDDATGFRYVYFIRHKSDVYERFMEFERLIFNKFGRTMKTLRTDNGTEYRNARMEKYMKEREITLKTTAPYTPEQNGRSKRDNRMIVEASRTMLKARNLPAFLWAEATAMTVYTINRTGQSRVGGSRTPYEQWTGKKPDFRHMRVFGSDAYAYVLKEKTTKFDARAKKLVLVGYDSESSNYRLYDPVTKCVSVSRHVVFNERAHGWDPKASESEVELTLLSSSNDDDGDEEPNADHGNGAVVGNRGADDVTASNAQERRAAEEDAENEVEDIEDEPQPQQEVVTPRLLHRRDTLCPPARCAVCRGIQRANYSVPGSHLWPGGQRIGGSHRGRARCAQKERNIENRSAKFRREDHRLKMGL